MNEASSVTTCCTMVEGNNQVENSEEDVPAIIELNTETEASGGTLPTCTVAEGTSRMENSSTCLEEDVPAFNELHTETEASGGTSPTMVKGNSRVENSTTHLEEDVPVINEGASDPHSNDDHVIHESSISASRSPGRDTKETTATESASDSQNEDAPTTIKEGYEPASTIPDDDNSSIKEAKKSTPGLQGEDAPPTVKEVVESTPRSQSDSVPSSMKASESALQLHVPDDVNTAASKDMGDSVTNAEDTEDELICFSNTLEEVVSLRSTERTSTTEPTSVQDVSWDSVGDEESQSSFYKKSGRQEDTACNDNVPSPTKSEGNAPLIRETTPVSDGEGVDGGENCPRSLALLPKEDAPLIRETTPVSDQEGVDSSENCPHLLLPKEDAPLISKFTESREPPSPVSVESQDSSSEQEQSDTEPTTETTSLDSTSEDDRGQRSRSPSCSSRCRPNTSSSQLPSGGALPHSNSAETEGGPTSHQCQQHRGESHEDIPFVTGTPASHQEGMCGILLHPSPSTSKQVASDCRPSSANQGELLVCCCMG